LLNPQQLIFDWTPPVVPAFDNFLAGQNAEVVAHLREFAAGSLAATSLLLWGAAGSGRTHLLNAAVNGTRAGGRAAFVIAADAIPQQAEPGALYALDDVDRLPADAQGDLFTLYNACRDSHARLLLTSSVPAARAPLRDDLRTRIGSGLILEVRPLADADKPAALAAHAREQGFRLGADVIAFLLTHARRDMGTLVEYLRALDRYSLATKRPVTVPLVKELLVSSTQREIPFQSGSDPN
jgi:DnaA family protein